MRYLEGAAHPVDNSEKTFRHKCMLRSFGEECITKVGVLGKRSSIPATGEAGVGGGRGAMKRIMVAIDGI